MIHAYNELYLSDAMQNLGEAMEFASLGCHYSLDEFWDMFALSDFAVQFASGAPNVVSGISGTELALKVLLKAGVTPPTMQALVVYEATPEFWCGWILAYYQWHSGRSFSDIHSWLSMRELEERYNTLHEATEEKCFTVMNVIAKTHFHSTILQRKRRNLKMTQAELAEKAGINLRTLQQYENRSKNINRAAGETLLALARTLGCRMEDLLEYGD